MKKVRSSRARREERGKKTNLNGHEILHSRKDLESDLRDGGEGIGSTLGNEGGDSLVGGRSSVSLVAVTAIRKRNEGNESQVASLFVFDLPHFPRRLRIQPEKRETMNSRVLLSHSHQSRDDVIVERAQRRRRGQRIVLSLNSQLLSEVHQTPTAVSNDPSRILESKDESRHQRREMNVGLDGVDEEIRDPSQRPSGGVLDVNVGILHHLNQRRESLSDETSEDLGVGTVEDGTEGHDGSFSLMPRFGRAMAFDVALDEGDDGGDDVVSDGLSEESESGSSGHRDVPLVVLGVFFLLSEELEEDGEDLRKSDFGEVAALSLGSFLELGGLVESESEYNVSANVSRSWEGGGGGENLTSAASMASSISSSQTVDQNSTA